MKLHPIALALSAVLVTASGTAGATTSATATLSNLTVSLSRISTAAGTPDPSVTFHPNNGGSETYTYAYNYETNVYEYNYSYGNGAAFSEVSGSTTTADGNASASLSGDVFSDAGAIATSSSQATGSESGNYTSSQALNWLGDTNLSFDLGANTLLRISGTGTISGFADDTSASSDAYAYAYASIYMNMNGANGPNTQSSTSSIYYDLSSSGGTVSDSGQSGSFDLDVSFIGSKTATTSGSFYGYLEAVSYTNVSSVPEPANIALMLAGLGLVAPIARRRRAG